METNGHLTEADKAQRLERLIANVTTARQEFLRQFMDPRRNYDDECGYPESASGQFNAEEFQQLYDREPLMWRVVNLYPKECWQATPEIRSDDETFMDAWQALIKSLVTGSHYTDEKGYSIFEYLYRADVLSRIGSFGVVLLGLNDGKMLQDPVEGVAPDGNVFDITGVTEVQSQFGKDMYKGLGEVSKDIYGGALPVQPLSSTMGTDALYRGIQFTPETPGAAAEGPKGAGAKANKRPLQLVFIRPYAQYLVQVVQYEADIRNPRFGYPLMYLLTLNDPRQQHTGVGLPLTTVRVHWSRMLHYADERQSSEIFGVPSGRPVLNRILDTRKLYGGSAEMYWRGAFPGISIETHPQLGGDVVVQGQQTLDMMEQYMNGLQRYLALTGMSAKMLSPTVVDPSGQIDKQIEAICIYLGCPKRVFLGSERGELASSQDDQAWNDRLRWRQNMYITPRIIVPFIDRLINIGILPAPNGGYTVHWPDLEALSRKDKSTIALTTTQAMAAYVGGNVEQICTVDEWYKRVLEMPDDEVEEIVDKARSAFEDDETMVVPSQAEEDEQKQQKQDQLDAMKNGVGQDGRPAGAPVGDQTDSE